jgi:DNA-directed RNA polymerase specialized sigma24 family protein
MDSPTHRTIRAIWRIESARLIAGLDAWLAATAKHRAIDELRRRRRLACHARARTAAETDWGTLRA